MASTPDDPWEAHHNYADLVTIVVTPVESPEETEGLEQWIVVSNGAAWAHDWLVREVEALALRFDTSGTERRGDYVLRVNQTRFSWGADAAQYEVLLWLAQWAATSAAWDALKALSKRMARHLSTAESANTANSLTETEAEYRARWLLNQRYNEAPDALTLVSIECNADGAAALVLTSSSGWRYELEFNVEDGLVSITRIKRSRPNE